MISKFNSSCQIKFFYMWFKSVLTYHNIITESDNQKESLKPSESCGGPSDVKPFGVMDYGIYWAFRLFTWTWT